MDEILLIENNQNLIEKKDQSTNRLIKIKIFKKNLKTI